MRATLAAVLASMLAGWLVLWWPFAGRWRYRRLAPRGTARRWSRSIRRKWLATAALVPIAWLADAPLADCGIRWPSEWSSTFLLIAGVAAGAAFMALRLELPRQRDRLRRVIQPFVELVPQRAERGRFVLVAVTAGVTEELLYRSFGLTYVHWLLPSASGDTAVFVTAAAFGLAHLYQGWKNVALTALLGCMFGWLTLDTGSVLPAMVVHTLIDLRILLFTPLVESPQPPAPDPRDRFRSVG